MSRLWNGFRQRKIATWTAAYVAVATALLGTLETIGNVFDWPPGVMRAVFFLLLAGLLATLILAWFHGERGRQTVGPFEISLLVGVAVAGVAAAVWSVHLGGDVGAGKGDVVLAGSANRGEPPDSASAGAALEAFAAGEEALRQRTPASVIQAIGKYRAAASLDPRLASARAREAYAYALFFDWGWTYPGIASEDLLDRAVELSDEALAIDTLSAEAWLARAYLLLLSDPHHPALALPAFSRAVDLDPTNPEAQHQFGQTLMSLGRYAEARSAYHAALAIEEGRPMTLVSLSAMARWTGDQAEAERWADSSVVVGAEAPYAWASRALNTMNTREPTQIAADARQALRIDPSYEVPARAMLAAALWRQGERDAARQELGRSRAALVDPETPGPTDALYLGAALVYMDRTEEALDLLEAARPRAAWLWFYLQCPAFDPLRADERFQAIVEESRGSSS